MKRVRIFPVAPSRTRKVMIYGEFIDLDEIEKKIGCQVAVREDFYYAKCDKKLWECKHENERFIDENLLFETRLVAY